MDSKKRCPWCLKDQLYMDYHDQEWGVPTFDDRRHFEFLVLESAQAGLSWHTILKKRENYRAAYAGFDPVQVADFTPDRIEMLLQNKGIIRNRLKIEASVNNARRFLEVQQEFGSFASFIWSFTNCKPVTNAWRDLNQIPAKTPLSESISEELKRRGFKFLGPVIIYSHLQATGLVNDHIVSCFRYGELLKKQNEEE